MRQRPPSNPRINWGHPLAERLEFFMREPDARRPYDLVTCTHGSSSFDAAGSLVKPTPYGMGYSWATTSQGSATWVQESRGSYSVAVIARLSDAVDGGGSESLFMVDSGSDRRAALYLRTFNNRRVDFIWDPNGVYYIAQDPTAPDLDWHHWLGTRRTENSSRPAIYRDGVLIGDASSVDTSGLPTPVTFRLATNANELDLAYAAAWSKLLNREEALWLYEEPYAFVEQDRVRRYAFMAGAGLITGGARQFSSIARARG